MAGALIWLSLIQADEGDQTLEVLEEHLESFAFVDRDRGSDVCELRFRDRNMRLLDEPALRQGQKLLVSWGWAGAVSLPRRMIVRRPKEAKLIKLLDESVLLDRHVQHRVWHDKTDGEVVADIAAANEYTGLLADISPTQARRANISQAGTDSRMLNTLARRNGFVWYIDAAGFHFHPRRGGVQPTHSFSYLNDPGQGWIMGEPTIEGRPQDYATVRVEARDPFTKKRVVAEVGAAVTGDDAGTVMEDFSSLGAEEEVGDPDGPDGRRQARASRKQVLSLGYATQEEVQAEAARRYFEAATGRYKMTVVLRGHPSIGAKQLHYYRLPSEAFSGLWYCREARTEISPNGYRVTAEYLRDALGKIGTERILGVRRKKNEKKPDADPADAAADSAELKRGPLSWGVGPNGNPVPRWALVDAQGNQVDSDVVTAEEWTGLSASERNQLLNRSAGGLALPGE